MSAAIENVIRTTKRIRIVAGYGNIGEICEYTGPRALASVKAAVLARLRHGYYWARAEYVRMTDVDGEDHFDRLPV